MSLQTGTAAPPDVAVVASRLADCHLDEVTVDAVPYDFGSPATAGIWRVRAPGAGWCVKQIHHPSLWPGLAFMPPFAREQFLREFPWRFELDIALSGIQQVMPPGMRTARLDLVDTPDEEHATMWWEWIDEDPAPWAPDDYAAAARALGRLAARRREGAAVNDALPPICGEMPRGYALRMYVEKRTLGETVPRLSASGVRDHPAVRAALSDIGPQLWDDLLALADRLPAMLDELDELPQSFAHGDASPQNLLRPLREPGTVVAIDWGFGTLLAAGFDLGQLVVGLVHAGLAPASGVPALVDVVIPAYTAGRSRRAGTSARPSYAAASCCRSSAAARSTPSRSTGSTAHPGPRSTPSCSNASGSRGC